MANIQSSARLKDAAKVAEAGQREAQAAAKTSSGIKEVPQQQIQEQPASPEGVSEIASEAIGSLAGNTAPTASSRTNTEEKNNPISTASKIDTAAASSMQAKPEANNTKPQVNTPTAPQSQSQPSLAQQSGYDQQPQEATYTGNALDDSIANSDAARLFIGNANRQISDFRTRQNAEKEKASVETEVKSEISEENSVEEKEDIDPINETNAAISDPKREVITHESQSQSYKADEKARKKQAKESVAGKNYQGNSIVVKTYGNRLVQVDAMSIGTDEVISMVAQPGNNLLSLIEKETGEIIDTSKDGWVYSLMDLVNQSQIEVGVYKSPVNRSSSGQRRYLRMHAGRGGRLHPTQSKGFNADFDGDDFTVVFDQQAIKKLKPAMSYLIDVDGSATLDMDFFPIVKLIGDGFSKVQAKRYLRSMFDGSANSNKIGRNVSEGFIDRLFDLCEKPDPNIKESEYLNAFIRALYKEGERLTPNDPYYTTARLLQTTYNGLRNIKLIKAELIANSEQPSYYQVPQKTQADHGLIKILDDVAGGRPMNFQDFKVAMNKYIGDVDGKNIAFRISADIAKMVKMNDRIEIGQTLLFVEDNGKEDSSNSFFELYQKTMQMGVSMQMSNLASMEDRIAYSTQILRNSVLLKAGMPNRYNNLKDFLDAFYQAYNEESQLIEIANVEFLTDFKARTGKPIARSIDKTIGGMRKALVQVYGNYTLGELFSDFARFDYNRDTNEMRRQTHQSLDKFVMLKYRDTTLERFSKENFIQYNLDEVDGKNGLNKKNISNASIGDLLTSIADLRISKASKYNKTLTGDVTESGSDKKKKGLLYKMHEAIVDLNKMIREKKTTDWALFAGDLTELLYSTSPTLFSHFNMGSTEAFLDSKYGKALLNAKSADIVGGIRMSMIIDQRMSKVDHEESRFNDLIDNTHSSIESIENAANRVAFEIDALASSSMAWKAIVNERYDNKAFKELKGKKGIYGYEMNALEFWNSPTHESLYDLLMDTNIGKEIKENVLSDVVRWYEKFKSIYAFEMTYQLEQGQSNIYSGFNSSEESNVLDTLENANKDFDKRDKKSYEAAQKNIENAYNEWHEVEEALEDTLKYIAEDPSLLVRIDDRIISDAIAAPLDKMFAVSEKSGQMPGPNSLYMALNLQKNGGLYSDLYRGDDRAIGIIRWDMLTPLDFVTLLANPEKTMTVYGKDGQPVDISRSILCGDNSEQSLWNFLMNNPRLGMAIREHHVNVISDTKGKAFLSSDSSTSALIYSAKSAGYARNKEYRKIKSAMIDHPIFHAMAALIVRTEGRTSRTISSDYRHAENYLIGELIRLARITKSGKMFDVQREIQKILGITPDFLIGNRKEGLKIEEDIAWNMMGYISDSLHRYANEIADIIPNDSYEVPPKYRGDENFTPQTDLSSVAMYFDVMQELHGSKTAISTSIEGTETYKMALWMSLLAPQDRYDLDDRGDVVEVPEGEIVQDAMLDSYGNQVSSVNRFLIVKRDKGAEEFNLKLKKFGIDDMDSITKNVKFGETNYNELLDKIRKAEDMFEAKMILAQQLKTENEKMGYDDMSLANYMSIADLMIIEKDEEGSKTRYLRSIEQVGYAIKNQISKSVLEDKLSIDEARAMAAEIADVVGTVDVNVDPVELMSGLKISGVSKFSPVLRQRSSSWHRNYNLVKEINEKAPVGRASKQQVENRVGKNNENTKRFEKLGYRYIGEIGGAKIDSIGPTEILTISNDASTDDIRNGIRTAGVLGNTVFIYRNQIDLLSDDQKRALVPFESGYILPMFDMRLNGSEAKPYTPTSATWQCDPSRVVWTYEDSINEHGLGDSDIQFFNALTDRMSFDWGDNSSISSGDLFADTFVKYPDAIYKVEFAEKADIKKFIVNNVEDYEIDYGIASMPSSMLEDEKARMNERIKKYVNNFGNTDGNGMLTEAEPDDIIGWTRCTIWQPGEGTKHILAPIIPFRIQGTMSVPTKYTIEGYDFGIASGKDIDGNFVNDKSAVTIQWRYSGDTKGQWIKMHESAGAANKTVGSLDGIEGPALRDGTKLDACYALETTASRRGGTGKRIATMNTMMFKSRMHPYGYNFANDSAGAFPDNSELREAFKTDRFTRDQWQQIINNNERLHENDELNIFCRFIAKKCLEMRNINPSDFFASEFSGIPTDVWFEFESIYEQNINFQDNLMKFMHSMMPSLVPDGIDGDWRGCLMRPDDTGCLQMQVPHQSLSNPGETFYVWENVYAGWGFFGEDYSGFKRPSVNGASRYMDALNTMALSGQEPSGFEFNKMLSWALSDQGGYNMPYSITPEKR